MRRIGKYSEKVVQRELTAYSVQSDHMLCDQLGLMLNETWFLRCGKETTSAGSRRVIWTLQCMLFIRLSDRMIYHNTGRPTCWKFWKYKPLKPNEYHKPMFSFGAKDGNNTIQYNTIQEICNAHSSQTCEQRSLVAAGKRGKVWRLKVSNVLDSLIAAGNVFQTLGAENWRHVCWN